MKLLDELQGTPVEPGELAICWLGQAGYCLKDAQGNLLLLDPYFTNCGQQLRGFKRLSAMLVDPVEVSAQYYVTTHIHFDHFDFEAIPVVAQSSPQILFLGPDSCMEELKKLGVEEEQCYRLNRGEIYRDDVVTIEAVWADHGTMAPDAIGVLLEMGGHRLYFSGDTAFREKLFQRVAAFRPEVAFLSVNGQFGNMTAYEGARAAELCGAKYAVPCHVWTIAEHQGNPYQFSQALENSQLCEVRYFRQGEIQVLDRKNELLEKEGAAYYESYPLYAARNH